MCRRVHKSALLKPPSWSWGIARWPRYLEVPRFSQAVANILWILEKPFFIRPTAKYAIHRRDKNSWKLLKTLIFLSEVQPVRWKTQASGTCQYS